ASPITTSGSVHSQSWLPSPIASPKRIRIRSGMTPPPRVWHRRSSQENGGHPTAARAALSSGTTTEQNGRGGGYHADVERGHFRLGFAGLGHVGSALARLLLARREELERRHDLTFETTLLATARRGTLVDPVGINLRAALDAGWSSPLRLEDA